MPTLKQEENGTSFMVDGVSKDVADHSYNFDGDRLTLRDEDGNPLIRNTHYGSITNADEGRKFESILELKTFVEQAFGIGGMTNEELLDRANHTGEQAISTVTGLQEALDSKQDIEP